MPKELKCPKCNSIVNHCIYTANLNGDRSWRCDECSYKFDTDINGNVREYVNDMNDIVIDDVGGLHFDMEYFRELPRFKKVVEEGLKVMKEEE